VEASIRAGFRELYRAIEADGCDARSLRRELREQWVDGALDKLTPRSANQDSFLDLTRRLVSDAASDVAVSLGVEGPRMSGNLDAQAIRDTCDRHGVSSKTAASARGGNRLELVKRHRNNLAHGVVSFAECGRDYTTDQLVEIRTEARAFLRGILRNLESCIKKRAYRLT
jgi:hypothetical protein